MIPDPDSAAFRRMPVAGKRGGRQQDFFRFQCPNRGIDQFRCAVSAQDLILRNFREFCQAPPQLCAILVRILRQQMKIIPKCSQDIIRNPQRIDIDGKVVFYCFTMIYLAKPVTAVRTFPYMGK